MKTNVILVILPDTLGDVILPDKQGAVILPDNLGDVILPETLARTCHLPRQARQFYPP